jgi:NDP-sugar pyrophosphorylase family protein
VKAMIFAAGLGTRLQPLTTKIPKALVEVNGVPLIEKVIKKLIIAGVTDIIVNLHHFPEKIKAFVEAKNYFQVNITFSPEASLLDTGGGLLNAAHFFDDGKPFILHNTDVLSTIDLTKMIEEHKMNRPLATLFVQNRKSSRYLLFNNSGFLAGWENVKTGEKIIASKHGEHLKNLAFNGIHIIDPKIFELFNSTGRFSIITEYLRLAWHHKIMAYENNDCKYIDAGKPDSLLQAATFDL